MFQYLHFFENKVSGLLFLSTKSVFLKGIDTDLKCCKLQCRDYNFSFKKRVLKKLVTHHPQRCKLLWHCGLQRYFDLCHSSPNSSPKSVYLIDNVNITFAIYPLTTRHPERGDEWIVFASRFISDRYATWGWWVGDEWNEMNHRRNVKSYNDLQRYGWWVTSFFKTLFLKPKLQSTHYNSPYFF